MVCGCLSLVNGEKQFKHTININMFKFLLFLLIIIKVIIVKIQFYAQMFTQMVEFQFIFLILIVYKLSPSISY